MRNQLARVLDVNSRIAWLRVMARKETSAHKEVEVTIPIQIRHHRIHRDILNHLIILRQRPTAWFRHW